MSDHPLTAGPMLDAAARQELRCRMIFEAGKYDPQCGDTDVLAPFALILSADAWDEVARMAEAAGMLCTPHMSGSGLGYLDAAHFVSCIPNPVAYTEFKGNASIPVSRSVLRSCGSGSCAGAR